MEYFDILDQNGSLTGQTKQRADVHRDGDWHRTVHVWIMNDKNELLLQKRSMNKDSYPNCWDISSAGHISAGDSSMETVLKEVEEELGILISEEEVKCLFSIKSCHVTNNGTFVDNEFNDVYLVKLNLDLSKLNLQKEEVSDVRFIHYKELKALVDSGDESLVPHHEENKKLFDALEKYLS